MDVLKPQRVACHLVQQFPNQSAVISMDAPGPSRVIGSQEAFAWGLGLLFQGIRHSAQGHGRAEALPRNLLGPGHERGHKAASKRHLLRGALLAQSFPSRIFYLGFLCIFEKTNHSYLIPSMGP